MVILHFQAAGKIIELQILEYLEILTLNNFSFHSNNDNKLSNLTI